jgi:tetratricopeptide (TPR) repeat protein
MRGSMQEAEQYFFSAARLDPEFSEAAFNLIKLLHIHRRYNEAIHIFNQFSQNKNVRTFPSAISNIIGECAVNHSDITAACECFDVLIRHSPIQTELACRYSSILINSGQLGKAKFLLEQANFTHPNDPSLLTQLSITESELGNYKRAVFIHQQLIKDHSFHFLSNYNYALFLSILGRDEEALQLLNICLDIVPEAPEAVSEIQRITQKSNSVLSSLYFGVDGGDWDLVKKLSSK